MSSLTKPREMEDILKDIDEALVHVDTIRNDPELCNKQKKFEHKYRKNQMRHCVGNGQKSL